MNLCRGIANQSESCPESAEMGFWRHGLKLLEMAKVVHRRFLPVGYPVSTLSRRNCRFSNPVRREERFAGLRSSGCKMDSSLEKRQISISDFAIQIHEHT